MSEQRLIDGNALKEDINVYFADSYHLIDTIAERIDAMPTIEERKTGKWIWETKHYKDSEQEFYYCEGHCSECGVKKKIGWADVRYCPMCGARLVQEGEDNERA